MIACRVHTRGRRAIAAFALGLGFVTAQLLPADADAYCRSMSIKDKQRRAPTNGAEGEPAFCPGEGVPLFWRSRCVGYSLSRGASKTVSLDDATRIVGEAFAKWTRAACLSDDPANSRVSIDARDLGPADCTAKGYNRTGPNQSLIVFRDDKWVQAANTNPTLEGSNTIALTSVFYDVPTGEIFDADMEINSLDHTFTTDSTFQNNTQFDLPSVVTHEVGHFLGLDHSAERSSAMYFNYGNLETTKQFLKNDDIRGLCSIYRPDGTRATGAEGSVALPAGPCDPTPRRGLDSTCAATSCSIHPTSVSAGSQSAGWLAGLTVAAALLWRRKHARRASFVRA